MKIKTWNPAMSDKETADLAYWERNMLALRYADGWYFDDVPDPDPTCHHEDAHVEPDTNATICRRCEEEPDPTIPRYPGWRRVLSLDGGKITFHIPDEFDVGMTKQIESNWDGHTTEEKWRRVAFLAGATVEP